MTLFKNRSHAGRQLAKELSDNTAHKGAVVLGLARGGVPVAFEVAEAHRLPMDVFVIHRLDVPGREELAMGAIASGGVRILNEEMIRSLNISDQQIATAGAQAHRELQRRERAYRGDHPQLEVSARDVILVDDGLETGADMAVAVAAIQAQKPTRLIVAVPMAAAEACRDLEKRVDEMVCILRPQPFNSVGFWYEDFSEVTDEQVKKLLANSFGAPAAGAG
jgi:putative phosphoribosyl transferase